MYDYPISYLNSNDGSGVLAFGEGEQLIIHHGKALDELDKFIQKHKGQHILGFISYDVKNEIESLHSNNKDMLDFPVVFFWVPKYVVRLRNEHFDFVQGEKTSESFEFLNYFLEEETDSNFHNYGFKFNPVTSKEEYIRNVISLKEHIQKGDIYEVNYCQEFYATGVKLPYPLDTYFKLNLITRAPFSSFLTFDHYSVFCGSPERYIQKSGSKLISQPIKGTAARGQNESEDEILKKKLHDDPKEQSENVMIVDLVRNDLSKIAQKGSVNVDELFGIYSFETVHQMISTISCDVKPEVEFVDIIRASFPMGSMTGAPKVKAMELIENHENFRRGLYSGTMGYITPSGDFDFNVVIRTLLYNQKKEYLSCSVGGAITIDSDPEKEYQECMVKIQRILDGMKN